MVLTFLFLFLSLPALRGHYESDIQRHEKPSCGSCHIAENEFHERLRDLPKSQAGLAVQCRLAKQLVLECLNQKDCVFRSRYNTNSPSLWYHSALCLNADNARTDFLRYADCFWGWTTRDGQCFREYKDFLVNVVLAKKPGPAVLTQSREMEQKRNVNCCCAFRQFFWCVSQRKTPQCGLDAGSYFKRFVLHLANVTVDSLCSKYQSVHSCGFLSSGPRSKSRATRLLAGGNWWRWSTVAGVMTLALIRSHCYFASGEN